MEGYMAEIRCFAGDFAPKTWALCAGQTLAISTNQALFSLLGTTYGGNGMQTFQLPNLKSRIPVGTGTAQYDGQTYVLGQIAGEENHTLTLNELPMHTHAVTVTQGQGAPAVGIVLNGTGLSGNTTDPTGALLANDDGSGTITTYAPASEAPNKVAMATGAITLSDLVAGTPTVTIGQTGGNQPHSNLQPLIAMNYIICLQGIFPSRN